ncbi:MAG: arginine--tRNA ligase [Planctomycetaceae bacterium]|nr:arginine--tRNA ligase [Planctomycetaceae bacterium]
MNILETLQQRFATVLEDFTDNVGPFVEMIRPSQDAKFGDYQANCAMPLGKQNGTAPREVALKIVDKLNVADLCEPSEVAGPGFINLTLRTPWLEDLINRIAHDERLGVEAVAKPKTIVVDFSSPNVAKPMHVGHLRSTVIGDSLARVFRFAGHQVITDNHIGDWGTQFGMIIYGFKHFVELKAYEQDPVGELARLYRLVNQLCDYHDAKSKLPELKEQIERAETRLAEMDPDSPDKQQKKAYKKQSSEIAGLRAELKTLKAKIAAVDDDPELKELADKHPQIAVDSRKQTAKLHAGDQENVRLWDEFLPLCVEALQKIYDRLDIAFDHTLGESFYNDQLADVVKDLEKKGLAVESDGAKCVFLEGHAAPFIVQKADGAYTYATTDLATIKYRVEEFGADQMCYVVDARQSEHFSMLFKTARAWGYNDVELQHVQFGTVMGKDGRPYKTRSGDTVGLESLLDEAIAKASEIVAANDDAKKDADGNPRPELSPEYRAEIAEAVGLGGVKYADLMHNRESDYVFDYDKMLATTGNTATYLQYAHARIYGIFRKGNILPAKLRSEVPRIEIKDPTERALALRIARYSEFLSDVVADCRPNLLTQYLFDLSNDLTAFYAACHVLNAEDEQTKRSRLMLCDVCARVLSHGMSLLGIKAPQQM